MPTQLEKAVVVGGIFAGLSIVLSFYLIIQHLRWNDKPKLRKYIVRIIFFIPVYALEAWMGLVYHESSFYFQLVRESYEALVIYSFYCFLVDFLGGDEATIELLSKQPPRKHGRICCCLSEWKMGFQFFHNTLVGTLQYAIIKSLFAIITFILELTHQYEEGVASPTSAYPYVAIITRGSLFYGMYCLIWFYMAARHELVEVKATFKFIVLKMVVLVPAIQAIVLALLARGNVINETNTYSVDNVAAYLQNFMVCVELLFAAFANFAAFHYRDFAAESPTHSAWRALGEAANLGDIYFGHVRKAFQQDYYQLGDKKRPSSVVVPVPAAGGGGAGAGVGVDGAAGGVGAAGNEDDHL